MKPILVAGRLVMRFSSANIKMLQFAISLPSGIGNHHAIEGYFKEIGYVIKRVKYTEQHDTDMDMYLVYWFVSLEHKPEAEVIMDSLAGKFAHLEDKIREVKKRHYG